MKIFVKTLTGKLIDLLVNENNTVTQVLLQVLGKDEELAELVEEDPVRLVYKGSYLEDKKTLGNYGITHMAVLNMIYKRI